MYSVDENSYNIEYTSVCSVLNNFLTYILID